MLRTTSVTGHGKAIRLIEFSSSFRAETKDFHINSCPPFMTIKQAPSDEAGRLSQELFELLHHISKETNIHHFWLEVLCLSSGQDQSIHEPVSRGEILKAVCTKLPAQWPKLNEPRLSAMLYGLEALPTTVKLLSVV